MKLRSVAAAIVMLVVGGTVHLLSSSGTGDPVRIAAWNLAKLEFQKPGHRGLPEFVTWYVRKDIYQCADISSAGELELPAPSTQFIEDAFSGAAHVSQTGLYRQNHDFRKTAQISFGEGQGFRYNAKTARRLCDLVAGAGSPRTASRQLGSWWKNVTPQPQAIAPPFPTGSATAFVFWYLIKRDSPNQNTFLLPVRSGSRVGNRKIQVVIPKCILDQTTCPAPATPGPEPTLVSLDKFVWVPFEHGDVYGGATPGDFLILSAFHLVHKQDSGWLWSTFWWDPESTEFATRPLGEFSGSDSRARAWNNYAMDAAASSNKEIFNPWREPAGSNCVFCHQHATLPLPDPEPAADRGPSDPLTGVLSFDFVFAAAERQ